MKIRCTLFVPALLGLLLLLALPASASAAPILGVQIARNPQMSHVNDEGVTYDVKVENEAAAKVEPGDELPCRRETWKGEEATLSFSYQWVRDGVRLESPEDVAHGSQTSTYTVQTSDAAAQLQCLVTGEHTDIENSVDHTTGHRIAVAFASKPTTEVAPTPPEAGPTIGAQDGRGQPKITKVGGGAGVEHPGDELSCTAPTESWNTIATASTTAGSTTLTAVTTATGAINGKTMEVGSNEVEVRPASTTGEFHVGQILKPAGGIEFVEAGTKIEKVEGSALQGYTLILSKSVKKKGVSTVTQYPAVAGPQPLEVGEEISAPGIPAGATIEAIEGSNVTLSAAATATAAGVPLTDQEAGIGVWRFEWLLNGAVLPGTPGSYPGAGEVTRTTTTTSTFKVAASELEQPGDFQCVAWATNAEGTAGEMSQANWMNSPAPVVPTALRPFVATGTTPWINIETGSPTSGSIHLHFELPGGAETRIYGYSATGWNCTAQQASGATHEAFDCERADALGPELSYPPLEVITIIGPDLEQPGIALAEASGGGSATATAEDVLTLAPPVPFGIESLQTMVLDKDGADYTQAGGHPFSSGLSLAFPTHTNPITPGGIGFLKDIDTDLPPGFLANPQAVPRECATQEQVLTDSYTEPTCPRQSIVGSVTVYTNSTQTVSGLPLYRLHPEAGVPAQFVFSLNGYPGGAAFFSLTPRLRPAEGYAISVEAPSLAKNPVLESISVKLCGSGVNVGPTGEQGQHKGAPEVLSCKAPGEAGANPEPFITNPTRCSGTPPATKVSVDSWENPGAFVSREAVSPEVTGCEHVPFEPTIEFEPTTHRAESPTGLDVTLKVPSKGLEDPEGISQSDLKKAFVTLPKGMSVNPSAADGLGACEPGQISLGTNDPVTCPDSSKVGSTEVTTPLLEKPLAGSIYLAHQGHNPFGSLLALYLVVESKERGILVKIPGRVEPKADGQLVAEFDENPQVPFSELKLHFNPGPRAALMTPPSCGTYGVQSKLYPWANPGSALESTDTFQVTEGPNGGACPGGSLEPKLTAGLANPIAATTSPFTTELSREDATQRFDGLDISLPPGLTAYLRGIPYCPDSALASISEAEGTGQQEIEHPSCPAASQLGTVSAGAGAGPYPYYVDTGHAYLAGPYKGAPLSIAVVAPAVAGPFDLGTVVVRAALQVNLETAQVTAVSDPLPTALHGIPLDLRDVRIDLDRPGFTLAPTNCEAMAVSARVGGEGGGSADVSNRFQVGGCGRLAFKPKLKLQLKGATRRSGKPALKAVVTFPHGGSEANAASIQVGLPHSLFLDQGNLNKVCTQPELKSASCPQSSVYGHVKAWTPLLDAPLQGNVYLGVGYGHQLPDLVAELNGQIRILAHGRVDTTKGDGLRNTFEVVPDAPVSRIVLQMKGGKKYSLIENSENLCSKPQKASARFVAQNGQVSQLHPRIAVQCGKKGKRHKKRSGHRRSRE